MFYKKMGGCPLWGNLFIIERDDGKKVDFPVTLYKEDVRKLSQPTNKVLAIFVKDYKQKFYTECTYISKGQEISKLPISEEMKTLIQVENDGADV